MSGGGIDIRVTGTRQVCDRLVGALTERGQLVGLVVVEASGWYPNRTHRTRPGTAPGGPGEVGLGRVYVRTHPAPMAGTGPTGGAR
jgi:hypothetical protein